MMTPNIDKPSETTLEKIDFVIQGLENGQFEDLAKKIDFHQKLKGEDSKRFIKTLLEVIDAQAFELNSLRSDLGNEQQKNTDLGSRVTELEMMLTDYKRNMRGIANGLLMVTRNDPFNQDGQFINEADAQSFVNDWKSKY